MSPTIRVFLAAAVTVAASAAPAAAECPELLRGVNMSLQQVEGGMAFTFITPRKTEVSELQEMLRMSAVIVEQHSQEAALDTTEMADFSTIELLPVDIATEDLRAGARVTVLAERTADTSEIRRQARKFELVWTRSSCAGDAPMLEKVEKAPPRTSVRTRAAAARRR